MSATEALALVERGEELLTARLVRPAIAALHRAEAAGADPDRCAGARWHCWMLLGEMEQAWRESDTIRARGSHDGQRFWDGSDPTGKHVMVRSLHGFGDAVQNLRFVPALRERAERVVLEVAPELLELARHAAGADEVVTWGAQAPAIGPAYDMQVEITELPYLLRCDGQRLAPATPYLHPPTDLPPAVNADASRDSRARVGVAWSSSRWDTTRSIPFEVFRAVLTTDDVAFWSLQQAADNGPWRKLSVEREWPMRVAGEDSAERTAAHLAGMDLVVTVDTFVAHLAGALGRPVWLLLKYDADWRWGMDRSDTPWYPTMRLFRQRERGQWQPVLDEIRKELALWSAGRVTAGADLGHVRRLFVRH